MTQTHTPGPWLACVTDGGHLVVGPDGYAVCALPSITRELDEQAANAALIEMAPDLLYRLSVLVSVSRAIDSSGVVVDEYEAALEEAETLLELLGESGITVGEVS